MKPSLLLWAYAATSVLGASWIAPGAVWYDTDGNKIDAHGGGVVKRGDTFYWVGHAASSNSPSSPKYPSYLNANNVLEIKHRCYTRPPTSSTGRTLENRPLPFLECGGLR